MLSELKSLRTRALRNGTWFKVLSPLERAICNLAMRSLSAVRSRKLERVLRDIYDKLLKALGGPFDALVRSVGYALSRIIASVAASWGHPRAGEWAQDRSFTVFLTVSYLNMPDYYRPQLPMAPP